jgi:hypothetical protein
LIALSTDFYAGFFIHLINYTYDLLDAIFKTFNKQDLGGYWYVVFPVMKCSMVTDSFFKKKVHPLGCINIVIVLSNVLNKSVRDSSLSCTCLSSLDIQ